MKRKLSKTEGPSLFAALVAVIAAIALFGACAGPQGEKGDPGDPGIQGLTGDPGEPATFFVVKYELDDGHVVGPEIANDKVFGGGKVREPVKIPYKMAVGETVEMPAGLYSTTEGLINHTFAGWFWDHDGDETTDRVPFDFDGNTITADTTIYAGWGDPVPVSVEANNVAAAVAHINTVANAGEYILVLDSSTPISTTPQVLTQNGVDLTIRGYIDETTDPHTVTAVTIVLGNTTGILFDVGPAAAGGGDVKLTIGSGITLKGTPTNNSCLVRIKNGGNFTMKDDAWITENEATISTGGLLNPTAGINSENDRGLGAAVFVQNGTFTMQDASKITGNLSKGVQADNSYYNKNAGGVYVANTRAAQFIMEKTSSVTANTNTGASNSQADATSGVSKYDVFIRSEDTGATSGSLIMGEGASIGILGLESRNNNSTTPASVTIATPLANQIHIRLWADTGGPSGGNTNCWKEGAVILRGNMEHTITSTDIGKFVIDGLYGRGNNISAYTVNTGGGWTIQGTGPNTNIATLRGR
jgi:hypothetical protein